MAKKKPSPRIARIVALCYIRLSFTLTPSEADSIERQVANCQAVCDRKGWIAEFHYDAKNHKSGRTEHNRPGWLALKERMNDPDVVAIVANDLARLHRKGWRVGQLLDWIEEHGVTLVLAAPGRELDLSNPRDRLNATFIAMMDEYYAADISQRVRDSIRYRKSKGITVGGTPFGTVRDDEGYLIPSPFCAWRLPNGDFVAGTQGSIPPVETAEWKGYYACANRILEIYQENKHGYDGIAFQMIDEGWAFRTRKGQPRRMTGDDVRRVVSNWREFAGLTTGGRAKDQNASMIIDAPSLLKDDTGRAVFGIDLLRDVARIQTHRSVTTRPFGSVQDSHPYALTGLLWCDACEIEALRTGDPTLRSKLTGTHKPKGFMYRHAEGHRCTGKVRSILTDAIEADFRRLIGLLTISPEMIPSLLDLSLSVGGGLWNQSEAELQQEKEEAISKAKRKMEAARYLYSDGELTREEYLRRREENEAEIASWEAKTTESERLARELVVCVDALNKITLLWDNATAEDRQGMARMMFESVTYDLNEERITNFKLKSWADKFIVLRAALYENEAEVERQKKSSESGSDDSGNESGDSSDAADRPIENGLESKTPPTVETFSRSGAICAPTGPTALS